MNYSTQNEEQYPYCTMQHIDLNSKIKSLKSRLIWCVGFSIVAFSLSPLVNKLLGIGMSVIDGGDMYIEMICVSLVFFCGANNFLIMTYYKFKLRLAKTKDLLLLVIAVVCYLSSMVDMINFNHDLVALEFIIIVDLLLFGALIKLLLVKPRKH